MYRTVKLIHESPTMFALFPLLIYVTTTTLLLVVVEAETSPPPQSEIKEAQKIVGRFLHNEAGTQWLSGLAKTNSAPLTSIDLMKAIRKITRKDGTVWKAATTLIDALESRDADDPKPDWMMGDNENWKDLIDNIEMEDDIICLYRKNTNETTKKADDWKKFLATVTPGYTVHLAIDTGIKYIICLKRLKEPIVNESSTEVVTTTSNDTSVSAEETSAQTSGQLLMKNSQFGKISIPMEQKKAQLVTNFLKDKSDEGCSDAEFSRAEHIRAEDYKEIDKDRMYDDYEDLKEVNNDGFESFRKFDKVRRGMTMKRTKAKDGSIGQVNHPPENIIDMPTPQNAITEDMDLPPLDHFECNRPIVFVLPDGNRPPIYQQVSSMGPPIQEDSKSNLQWLQQNSSFLPKMFPLYNSLNEERDLDHFMPQQNHDGPIIDNKIQNGFKRFQTRYAHPSNAKPPRFGLNPNSFVKTIRPSIQMPLDSQFLDRKLRGPKNVKLEPKYIGNQRNPMRNSWPLRFGKQFPAGRIISPLPNRGPLGRDQWREQSIPRRVEKLKQAKNEYLMRLDHAKNANRNSQLNRNPLPREVDRSSIYRFQTELPRSTEQSNFQTVRPNFIKHNSRYPPMKNQGYKMGSPQNFMPNLDPRNSRLFSRPVKNVPHSPCENSNPTFNQLRRNNLLPQIQPIGNFANPMIPILNLPRANEFISGPLNPPPLARIHNALDCPTAENRFQNYQLACPTACDRPIKLKIMVNGKVQEPLSINVATEDGQKLEISGSVDPPMSYGGRALNDMRVPLKNEMFDNEEIIQPEVNEGFTQSDLDSKEETTIRMFKSDDTEEEKLMIQKDTQTTSLRSDGQTIVDGGDIEDRFLHDATIETTVSLETNGTISTTVNSTNIV